MRQQISLKLKLLSSNPLMKNTKKSDRLKSHNLAKSSANLRLSTTSISQFVESQSPWIIDLGVSCHIYGNTSLFSSLSFPKNHHFITLVNGSKFSATPSNDDSAWPIAIWKGTCSTRNHIPFIIFLATTSCLLPIVLLYPLQLLLLFPKM